MKKLNLLMIGVALTLPALSQAATNKGIEGSVHDFSNVTNNLWNTRSGVCSPCHAAHHTDPAQLVPLWVHATSTATFQMYSSPSMDAVVGTTPTGASLACLSCHDGTLAYNQLKGQVPAGQTPQYVSGDYVIGNGALHDLRGDHPISFSYTAAVSASPTNTLKLPAEVLTTTLPTGNNLQGQTVDKAFLKNGQMECTSCHDVHRTSGNSAQNSDKPINGQPHNPLLVAYGVAQDGYGSSLCRSCHNK